MLEAENSINVFTLDPEGTMVREDGFQIETNPSSDVLLRLTIVGVLPPLTSEIDIAGFQNNLNKSQGERNSPVFLERVDRVTSGLQSSNPQNVLFVSHEFRRDDEFMESIGISEAIATPYTYKEFVDRADFPTIQKQIEQFLEEDNHAWYLYKARPYLNQWRPDEDRFESRFLVHSMLYLFNSACSRFASRKRIPTIKRMASGELHLGVHDSAKFNSPIRNAISFINIANLSSFLLEEETPFFNETRLKSLGITTQTT